MITKKKIYIFEKKIDYFFKNKEILIASLVHPSFTKDHKIKKNIFYQEFERFEFLGDRVLGLVVSSLIYSKFLNSNEGDLSKKLSYLVQKNFLYKISTELLLNNILKFSFKTQNEKMNISILADAVEALIGAIYIDGGYKSSIKFIKKYWGPYLNVQASNLQDPKTKLQEIFQQKFKKLPTYKLTKKHGPAHSPTFSVSLKVPELKLIKATGSSIREAEKNAALVALEMFNGSKNS